MENVVKNIHLLKDLLSAEVIDKIEHAALQYRKYARIYFKIIGLFKNSDGRNVVTIEVKQEKSPAENYLSPTELFKRSNQVFQFLHDSDGFLIHTNSKKYVESPTEVVTPEYIRGKLTDLKIKQKALSEEMGVDVNNLSAWINGLRPMSNPVKAMFYFYFKFLQVQSNYNIEKYDAAKEKVKDVGEYYEGN